MEAIERLAEEFLSGGPSYVGNGQSLPVPIEDIADSHVGLLVRDVEDLATAPGARPLHHGSRYRGCCCPSKVRFG
jgi:hypothetical protein